MSVAALVEIQDSLIEFQVAKSHVDDARSSFERTLRLLGDRDTPEAAALRENAQKYLTALEALKPGRT